MLTTIKEKDRHFSDMGWLQTYWLFSFGDYYDPENLQHGSLRVFNDDTVLPNSGFGTHPHAEMEIVSIILQGTMTHEDTMGNEMVVKENDVQRMTAGTGLRHSEKNNSEENVRFFQIWILPDKDKLDPSYDQMSFPATHWENRLALLASDRGEGVVQLNTPAQIYRASLSKEVEITHKTKPDHVQFLYVIEGEVEVNQEKLLWRDQARINDEELLTIQSEKGGEFLLIEVPTQEVD